MISCATGKKNTHYVITLFACSLAALLPAKALCADTVISIQPQYVRQGDVARITISSAPDTEAPSCRVRDIVIALCSDDPGLYYGFIPVSMDHAAGEVRAAVMVPGHKESLAASFEVIEKKFPEQRITVDESKASLSTEDLARHNRERALIQDMFAHPRPQRLWTNSFGVPLQGRISTPFGVRRFINGQPRNPHTGVDIAAPAGTPVRAASGGIVSLTGEHFFAGRSVYIDHGADLFSMYFHLDSVDVRDGQQVAAGDVIGRVGATGRATGPHLHWGIRIQGVPVDPFSLIVFFE